MSSRLKLFLFVLILLSGCKKYPEDSKRTLISPRKRLIEKTWHITSYKIDDQEYFNTFVEYEFPYYLFCNNGDSVRCRYGRIKYGTCTCYFGKNGVTTFNVKVYSEKVDTIKTIAACKCIYTGSDTSDYEDRETWEFDEHKKTLKMHDELGREYSWIIKRLEKNVLHIYAVKNKHALELVLQNQ